MECQRFTDAIQFLNAAESFLEAHDPQSNLILSNAYRMQKNPPEAGQPAYLALVRRDDGQVLLATVMGYRLPLCVYAVCDVPEYALSCLIRNFLEWQIQVQEDAAAPNDTLAVKLVAPAEVAHSFARVWQSHTNGPSEPGMHMRLYELKSVRDPVYRNGCLRVASESDKSLVARWVYEMDQEAVGDGLTTADAERSAESLISNGRAFLWEAAGVAVTMVCKTRPTKRGIVINGVYTPPMYRRHGYATSCVASVSKLLLQEGYEFCSLFTDMTNPTSNHIYMNIGYQPLRDYYEYKLTRNR